MILQSNMKKQEYLTSKKNKLNMKKLLLILLCFPVVSYGEYLNNFIDNIIEQEKLSNKKN